MSNTDFFQMAYCVPNARETALHYATTLGAGPFAYFPDRAGTYLLRGERVEARFSVALGFIGKTEIEILEPVGGTRSIFSELLDRNGPGLHHICFFTDDIDAYEARLTGDGYSPCWTGAAPEAQWFRYFERPGTAAPFIEVAQNAPGRDALHRRIYEWSLQADRGEPVRDYASFLAFTELEGLPAW
jgi:hypothetical protein